MKFWSVSTVKKLKSRKNLFIQFNEKCKLNLNNISEKVLNQFVVYQTNHCISKCSEVSAYTNSTILKNLNYLKWFLRWAENKGYEVNQDYKKYKPNLKIPEKDVIFLTWDELMKVYSYDFSMYPNLDIVRDGFCLCCFTSLRYSDLQNLKKENIDTDYINITTIKTSETLKIDLNKYSRAILEKYKDYPGDKALPVISNQKMNDNIKKVCRMCGIDSLVSYTSISGNRRKNVVKHKWEIITTHCGRRTFICNRTWDSSQCRDEMDRSFKL